MTLDDKPFAVTWNGAHSPTAAIFGNVCAILRVGYKKFRHVRH